MAREEFRKSRLVEGRPPLRQEGDLGFIDVQADDVVAENKGATGEATTDRRGQTLFIDARNLGHMVDRAERALSDDDIAKIAGTFAAWRGIEGEYDDVPGFCRSVPTAEIKAAGYALTPGRYVGTAAVEDDGEPLDEKIERLTRELFEAMDESARLDAVVREQLGRLR